MTSYKFLSLNLLIMLTLSFVLAGVGFTTAQTDDTTQLQAANTAVEQAFNSVSAVEKAGANVTGLLEQLNIATDLLAQAENSYRTGDTSAAANYVDQAVPIAQQVKAQTIAIKNSAISSKQTTFVFTVVFVVISSEVFILSLFFVWRLFKKNYINKMLESKPEVFDN